MLKVIGQLLQTTGTNPRSLARMLRGAPQVIGEYRRFKRMAKGQWPVSLTHLCFRDRWANAGSASGHYFHQEVYVARKIMQRAPLRHVDVGSSVHGFVSSVSVFREIEVIDIRPIPNTVRNVRFRQADVGRLSPEWLGFCDSLSCLHALEHFGLGRYGDPLDVDGHVKGFNGLASMLKPGGRLYLSVPIGHERVEFNAHRVFSPATILALLKPRFDLVDFAYVNDAGDLVEDVQLTDASAAELASRLSYGCGIFEGVKR